MARIVLTLPQTISGVLYPKGATLEATAAVITALGAAQRAVTTTVAHDQLGEAVGVSNGS